MYFWNQFIVFFPYISKAHSSCPCSDPSMSPPGKEMYNRWNVPPVRVLERLVCVFRSMDGHRSPEWLYSPVKVTNVVAWIIQAWICTMDWPVEKTPPTDMILEREVMIHDGGTIEKRERWWIMRKNLFSGLERAGGGGWGTPPLVGYFQEKWLVFTSIIAPFPPTPGLWFPRNPDTFRLLGWSTINASLDFSSIYRGLNSLHTLTVFQRFQLKTLLNGKEGFERAGGHHQTLWIKILVQTFTG